MTVRHRAAAALVAAVGTATGGVAVTLAVAAGPSPGFVGYVSEAGASASPTAWTYRLGLLTLAAALVLLGLALPATLRFATGLLLASALATVISAGVSCRAECPLPPFDQSTLADLVHGGASIAAVAGPVFAMLVVARTPGTDRSLRRLAAVAATVAVPLSVTAGVTLLVAGRGIVMGTVERLLLIDLAAWGLATALTVGLTRAPGPAVAGSPGPATGRSTGPR